MSSGTQVGSDRSAVERAAAVPPTVEDITGVDRRQLAGARADAGHRRVRLVRRRIPGLDVLVDVHAGARHPLTLAVDGGLLLLAAALAGFAPLATCVGWAALLVAACYAGQVYSDRDSVETQGVLWFVVRPITPLVVIAFVADATGFLDPIQAGMLVGWSLALMVGARCATWLALVALRRRGLALRRTLIVGTDSVAAQLWKRLVEFPEAGLVPVQMLDWALVSSPEMVEREIARHDIAHVVLVARQSDELRFTSSLRGEDSRRVRFSVVPVFADLFVNPASMTTIGSIPLQSLGQVMRLRRGYAGKRVMDVALSTLMLLIGLPVMLATALAIKLDDGGPVFFRQSRVGLEGRTFHMIKFRSMRVDAERQLAELAALNASDGLLFKLESDPRVTRVGRFIRRTSLDELPQLLNVLTGQMSLVGPRPLPVAPDQFDAWDNERHAALPGITGYWQISGGTALGYDEMVRLDLAYIRNAGLMLDLRLLARTVPALLHRRGPA